ncbi:hypothetical protein [Streptomyces adustus]|uniref:hypothetical protein n=1 Tax=Streptomyces adustus TaxID=1609272 RepID=UPI00371CEF5F
MTHEPVRAYDVVVMGAGPVGENVADRACAAGLRTVIMERELLGAECSFQVCAPSKAPLRPVLTRADARRAPGLAAAATATATTRYPLDVDAVLAQRDRMAAH